MKLDFFAEVMPREVLATFDRSKHGYFDEFERWTPTSHPGYWRIDKSNDVWLYCNQWLRGPEDYRAPVFVYQVFWKGRLFRFYCNIFYTPESDRFYGDIRNVCWIVFRIDCVEGWSDNGIYNIEEAKGMVIDIVNALKDPAQSKYIDKAEVKFVDQRCVTRPKVLLGE